MIGMAASEIAVRIAQSRTFPDGGVIVSDTIRLRDLDAPPSPRCRTAGKRPRFMWRGPASVPVFALENCREASFEHLDVVCETPCQAVFLSERTRSEPGTIPSTMAQFRDVRVYGNGLALHGFWYRATIDENNEHGRWDSCSVYGCVQGWRFAGQQSKEHLLTHCRFESGVTALSSDSGFQWIGGTVAVCDTGIFLARPGDPVLIQGVGFEACKRLLLTVRATTDAQPITLIGCRYAADQLHDDGAMIVLRHAGPLSLIGGSYGDGDQRVPHIALQGIGEQAVNIIGAKFGAFGASEVDPIRSAPGVRVARTVTSCTYERVNGAAEHSATRVTL